MSASQPVFKQQNNSSLTKNFPVEKQGKVSGALSKNQHSLLICLFWISRCSRPAPCISHHQITTGFVCLGRNLTAALPASLQMRCILLKGLTQIIMLSASGTHVHSVPRLSTWIWVTEMSNNSHYGKTHHITALKVRICHLRVLPSEHNNSPPLLLSHPDAFHQALQRLILNLGLTRIYVTPQE